MCIKIWMDYHNGLEKFRHHSSIVYFSCFCFLICMICLIQMYLFRAYYHMVVFYISLWCLVACLHLFLVQYQSSSSGWSSACCPPPQCHRPEETPSSIQITNWRNCHGEWTIFSNKLSCCMRHWLFWIRNVGAIKWGSSN